MTVTNKEFSCILFKHKCLHSTHTQSKKKSIRRSENKDQKEMINSKKERKNSKKERKNTPARTYENKNFELQKCPLTC